MEAEKKIKQVQIAVEKKTGLTLKSEEELEEIEIDLAQEAQIAPAD